MTSTPSTTNGGAKENKQQVDGAVEEVEEGRCSMPSSCGRAMMRSNENEAERDEGVKRMQEEGEGRGTI